MLNVLPAAFCNCASRSAADESRRPAADDQNIDVERLSLAHFASLTAETRTQRIFS